MVAKNRTFQINGELEVKRLGFGAMRLCGDGVWHWPNDPVGAHAVLRRALELGIQLIDTSDAYGPEINEYQIAKALTPYPDDLLIATKGGLTRGGPRDWQADGRPEHLKRALKNSLRRLEVERIDLYQLHTIDQNVPLEESLGALKELQQEGLIRFIGVSNFRVPQLERARKVVDVVTVQNRYNLGDREHEEVLNYCQEHQIGFLPWYPLAVGEVAENKALQEIAVEKDATVYQIALSWLLHKSEVMLPIPGTSSVQHLEENWAAREIDLTAAEMTRLESS